MKFSFVSDGGCGDIDTVLVLMQLKKLIAEISIAVFLHANMREPTKLEATEQKLHAGYHVCHCTLRIIEDLLPGG